MNATLLALMRSHKLVFTASLCCCAAGALWGQEADNLVPAARTSSVAVPWRPLSTDERVQWYLDRTTGTESVLRGVALAGFATWRDTPSDWNRDAGGYSARFASRHARITISNSVQLGMGFLLKDDPRYHRAPEKGVGGRLKNALVSTVTARDASGRLTPAYSRFAGIGVSNVIAKTWLPPSCNTWSDVGLRSGAQLGGQVGFNLLREFWPDIKRKFKK